MGQVPALVIDGHTLADSVSLLFEITYNIIVLTFNIMVPCKQRFQFSLAWLLALTKWSALLVSHAVEKPRNDFIMLRALQERNLCSRGNIMDSKEDI